MMVSEGQKIEKGEILFSFVRNPEQLQFGLLPAWKLNNFSREQIAFEEDLTRAQNSLRLKIRELEFVGREIRRNQEELERIRKLITLKLETEAAYARTEKELIRLRYQKELLREEISHYNNRLDYLKQMLGNIHSSDLKLEWIDFPGYKRLCSPVQKISILTFTVPGGLWNLISDKRLLPVLLNREERILLKEMVRR